MFFSKLYYLCNAMCIVKQTMAKNIKHLGIIESIDGAHIQVRIEQSSACASCKAVRHCNASESKEKIVDVYCSHKHYHVGQQVMVCTSFMAATSALFLGFVLPLLLLLFILLIAKQLGFSDEQAALSAILSLVPYYISLWIFQRHIKKQITFQIEEI